MKTEWQRITDLFAQALDLPDAERLEFLKSLHAKEPAIAAEVASLLESHDDAMDFMSKPVDYKLVTDAIKAVDKAALKLVPGSVAFGFRIEKFLGEGAFSQVYLARDLNLDRMVALKITAATGREAQTMAVLDHEHIVRVYSEHLDEPARRRMICMQYIAGVGLRKIIKGLWENGEAPNSGRDITAQIDAIAKEPTAFNAELAAERLEFEKLSFVEAVATIGIKVALALEHAHRHKILHLDVKPENILFNTYAKPMLADFNISVSREQGDGQGDGVYGGTAGYMAPEHMQAFATGKAESFQSLHATADVYALGVVLMELLTGRLPDASPYRRDMSEAEHELALVLHRCMSRLPHERFQTAGDMAAALQGYIQNRRIHARLPVPSTLVRMSLKSPVRALVVFSIVPQVFGSLVNIFYNHSRIVTALNTAQKEAFNFLLVAANPILYAFCVGYVIWFAMPIIRFVKLDRPVEYRDVTPELRQRVVQLPNVLMLMTTIGWLSGYFIFPFGIQALSDPLDVRVFTHFAISFVLSWIVSMTYSYLYVQVLVVRVLYPRMLVGAQDPRAMAAEDLAGLTKRFKIFQALAGVIPLAAAILALGIMPLDYMQIDDLGFRILLLALISSGTAGFIISLRTSSLLSRTVYALTGR